jgi:16S rRNA (cytosine967-C5)-methyltransferase
VNNIVLPFSREEALRVRPLVVQACDESRSRSWPFLSDVLAPILRGVPEEDAGIAAAAVHAMVKFDRLLGFACGTDIAGGASTTARFDALFALAANRAPIAERIERIDNAVERIGIAHSMPDWIVELVRDEGMLGVMNEPAPRCLRVNTLKATREATMQALAREGVGVRPTKFATNGLLLEGRRSPFRTQAFARGDFEMQDEGSQIVADLVAPPPRSLVIDVCAGAGGKTLALASLLHNKGLVVALDVSREKLTELKRRARRAGASNVQAVAVDVLQPGEALRDRQGGAKRVLVDAPCTGFGAIRRNP